jgi:predicted DsbA family dithiol-disulfide isomerase
VPGSGDKIFLLDYLTVLEFIGMVNKNEIMKIEIWSDLVCPFCYIGKRRFEEALKKFPAKDKIKIEWKSFLLDPHSKPIDGKTIHEALAAKKGWTIEQAKSIGEQVTEMAAEVGLDYQFDRVIPANTFDAHRLTHLALQHGLQDKAEEILFHAYFTEGKNLSDLESLVQIGVEIGLNEDEVRGTLLSDAFVEDVKSDAFEAEQLGIRGVPFFVFDRKYAVSGAQPVEVFENALNNAWKEIITQPITVGEDESSCQINSDC